MYLLFSKSIHALSVTQSQNIMAEQNYLHLKAFQLKMCMFWNWKSFFMAFIFMGTLENFCFGEGLFWLVSFLFSEAKYCFLKQTFLHFFSHIFSFRLAAQTISLDLLNSTWKPIWEMGLCVTGSVAHLVVLGQLNNRSG